MVRGLLVAAVIVILGLFGWLAVRGQVGKSTTNETAKVKTAAPSPEASPKEVADEVVKTATDPKKGEYLTDSQGHALYTYDKDATNTSKCDSDCAKTWKPYTQNAKPEPTKTPEPLESPKVKPTGIIVKPIPVASPKIKPLPINTFTRDDGTAQYSYKGKALYHYSGDDKATDIKGDGMDGLWHLAKP